MRDNQDSGGSIPIEKGVPIPSRSGGKRVYPFDRMKVGDSFFVAGGRANTIIGCARSYRNRNGGRFTTRAVTENGVKGVRVWRIE